ncbi:hypothetical protein ACF1BU_31755 [Streptomyces sp. NPDC014724]|uniref:hypothetical protein n=1 Tax=unclassified Streptomyces TaxID=2593676 RepID=UPI0036F5F33D
MPRPHASERAAYNDLIAIGAMRTLTARSREPGPAQRLTARAAAGAPGRSATWKSSSTRVKRALRADRTG